MGKIIAHNGGTIGAPSVLVEFERGKPTMVSINRLTIVQPSPCDETFDVGEEHSLELLEDANGLLTESERLLEEQSFCEDGEGNEPIEDE